MLRGDGVEGPDFHMKHPIKRGLPNGLRNQLSRTDLLSTGLHGNI